MFAIATVLFIVLAVYWRIGTDRSEQLISGGFQGPSTPRSETIDVTEIFAGRNNFPRKLSH
jgi:hypothetical protein